MSTFPEAVRFLALIRAGYRCECMDSVCQHPGRCKELESLQVIPRLQGEPVTLENSMVRCPHCLPPLQK